MKTYTDADVRKALAALCDCASYRKVAALIGIEHSHLNRMVRGEREVTAQAARFVGFHPVDNERKWVKAPRAAEG